MSAAGARVVITGAQGFVGRHLATHLRSRGYEVVATDRHHDELGLSLPDEEGVFALLEAVEPAHIVHLAAVASARDSERDIAETYRVNVEGTRSVVRAMQRTGVDSHLLFVSTSAVYGAPDAAEITEKTPPRPGGAYALSKLVAESVLHACAASVRWTIARPFNHTGPGQSDHYVLASFARQIALIEAGQQERRLAVGNLSVAREFLDVRDVVAAYEAILRGADARQFRRATFNVAAGRARPLSDYLDLLLELSDVEIDVVVDPTRVRSSDPPRLEGDATRLEEATGWRPHYPIERTLSELLEAQRAEVAQ